MSVLQTEALPLRHHAIVPGRGLEPPRIAPLVPKTSAYTNSATWAYVGYYSIFDIITMET
jgi:hypothetical protein